MSDILTTRPDWDDYGIQLARTVATRADCTRRQVGAVLMASDHSIITTGYNGGPSKGPSCLKGECPRGRLTHAELPPDSPYDTGGGTCVALHAEWNVLLRASWAQMTEATLYVTEEPCHICKSLIKGTQIRKVVWPDGRWELLSEKDRVELEAGLAKSMAESRAVHKAIFSKTYSNTEMCGDWADGHSWNRCTKPKGHQDPHGFGV